MYFIRTLSCLTILAAVAHGQSGEGALSGTVFDPGGRSLARATVQLKNATTNPASKTVSGADGHYAVADLKPGTYDVMVVVPGLKPFEKKGIVVGTAMAKLDIRLEEGTQLSTLGEDPLAIAADMSRQHPPSGPTPRTMDGKPDLSGVWWGPRTIDPGKPEWLPAAEAVAKQRIENNAVDSPLAHCLPSPITRLGPLFQFSQTKDAIVVISDDDSPGFHQIRMSRTQHPKEPDTDLWYGDSIGRWDGDTLVVDRVSFNPGAWMDRPGHPHSDKLHVIERYRRPDLGHLEQEITIEDPGVLAQPWHIKQIANLAPDQEIREFICAENNRDVPHLVGK